MNIYPAIDILDGQVVRLRQGQFDELTVYGSDPLATAKAFEDQGARYLHIVDLAGSRSGVPQQAALIASIARATRLQVQVGGGIRTLAAARALVDAGVHRVVLGSLAVDDPATALAILAALGPEHVTLGADLMLTESGPALAVSGWTRAAAQEPFAWLHSYLEHGLTHVLCTDISRDGILTGPNVGLYRDLLVRQPRLRLMASGGVAALADLAALRGAGLDSVIIGRALYERCFTLAEALVC